jgi:hypothetical protein
MFAEKGIKLPKYHRSSNQGDKGLNLLRNRLFIWAAVASAVLLTTRIAFSSGVREPVPAELAAAMAFCACGSLGSASYCFATFILFRELQHALTSVGFFALCSGSVLQAVVDTIGEEPAFQDWIIAAAWLLASVAFAGAAHSSTTFRFSSRKQTFLASTLVLMLTLGFPLAVLSYAFDFTIFYGFSIFSERNLIVYISEKVVGAISFLLVLIAFKANYRRLVLRQDRISAIMCSFLVPSSFSLLFRTASVVRFDPWWTTGHLLMILAWLAFMVAAGAINALVHKEASDRLSEMETMYKISWSLVGAANILELPQRLAQMLAHELKAEIVSIYLADNTKQSLRLVAQHGPDECSDRVGIIYPLFSTNHRPGFHSGHTARAFTSGETQVADDVFIDVELVPWRMIAAHDGRAVSLPLIDKRETIGVLTLYFADREQLTPQRLKLLTIIATAVSPAIGQARQLESEQFENEQLDQAA